MQKENKTCLIRNAKMVRFFFAFILIILTILSLSSCLEKKIETFVSGDFVCFYSKKYSEDKSVGIVIKELSEEGKQKEVIVVPEYIDGYRVYIYEYKKVNLVAVRYFNGLRSENLKKVFIMHKINSIHSEGFLSKTKVISMQFDNFYGRITENVFIPYDKEYKNNKHQKVEVINANVIYYVDDEIYWIDDYDNELITYIPEEPKKEGKAFVGWYKWITDPVFIRKWDFDYDTVSGYTSGYDFETNTIGGYIEWHICTELYAKFE